MSATGEAVVAIHEALDAEGGQEVADVVIGFLQELPVHLGSASVDFLIGAVEQYVEDSEDAR